MEDVREYLHLYIGHECMILTSGLTEYHRMVLTPFMLTPDSKALDYKPILRRLDSMTEEEMEDVWHMIEPKNVLTMNYEDGRCRKVALCSERTIYLLSKGFWLFGDEAFDKGLIIDKDKM